MSVDVNDFRQTPEQKAHTVEWIADLRSGNFPQGRRKLRTDAGYCCLGVGAETAIRCGLEFEVQFHSSGEGMVAVYDGEVNVWTPLLSDYFGLFNDGSDYRRGNPVIAYVPCDSRSCKAHWTGVGGRMTPCGVDACGCCCTGAINGTACTQSPGDLVGVFCHSLAAATANDDSKYQWTLTQIADAIEATYITGTLAQAREQASELGAVNFDPTTGLWRS